MDKHKLKVVYIILGIVIGLLNLNISFANNNDIQSKCFDTLKQNLSEIGSFATPYKEIKNMQYSNLENNFSRYYKNMSSFGIDLDEPLFQMRLYSFGKQTGYIHPPYSPFAVGTKSEKWDKATKEYIIAEEYITKPDGTKQFLSCSFMQMSAKDLMNIKANNYWYDGEIISVIKENDQNNKIWYNENTSFDYKNTPFVDWKRLFIYPKETKNNYFDRFSTLDSFPSNNTNNYNFLSNKDFGTGTISKNSAIYVYDTNGNITSTMSPSKELFPIKKEANNLVFPLFSYYQNIEDTFPEFAKHIALRGELHFNILKEIIGTKDNKDYAYIWNTILDSKGITKYLLNKKNGKLDSTSKGEKDFYEKNIALIGNYENEISKIKEKTKNNNIDNNSNSNSLNSNSKESNNIIYIIVISLIIVIATTIIILKRKK